MVRCRRHGRLNCPECSTRRLLDIEVDEISLVDSAATRKKFAIVKAKRRKDMDLKQALSEFIAEAGDLADGVKKALQEDARQAIVDALALLKKYLADMPEDVTDAVKVLAAAAAEGTEGKPKKKPDYGYGYPEKSIDSRAAVFYGKRGDPWPSISARASSGALLLSKSVEEGEEDEEEDELEQPPRPLRRGLKKSLDSQEGDDQGDSQAKEYEDFWPSLG